MSFSGVTSIVSALQRDEPATFTCGTAAIEGECVDAYQVLTVLDNPPADFGKDSLRPPLNGTDKTITPLSAFDFSRLPSRPELTGASPAALDGIRRQWAHSIGIFSMWDVNQNWFSEGGRAFRAHILVHNYGAGLAKYFNNTLMTMFSDDNTFPQKRRALAAMLTYGLDNYAAMHGAGEPTRYYGSGAGQFLGNFFPSVFATSLLIDPSKATTLSGTPGRMSESANFGPQELDQVNIIGTVPVWGDAKSRGPREYWQNLFEGNCYNDATGECRSIFGSRAQRDPYGYIDGSASRPGWSYMGIGQGVQRGMVAAMCVMPELADIVNYDPLIEFIDRTASVGIHTMPDPCAPPDLREPSSCRPYAATGSDPNGWNAQAGCNYYTVTWGPDPSDTSKCITNNQSPNTGQTGRFSARHGESVGMVYHSEQVEANWAALRGNSATCRTTD